MLQTGEVQLIPQPLTEQGQQGRANYEEMLYLLLRTMSSSPLDKLIGKRIPLCLLASAGKDTASIDTTHTLFELLQKPQKRALF